MKQTEEMRVEIYKLITKSLSLYILQSNLFAEIKLEYFNQLKKLTQTNRSQICPSKKQLGNIWRQAKMIHQKSLMWPTSADWCFPVNISYYVIHLQNK